MSDDDDDVRQAAFLRYRFQEDSTSSIWGYLIKSGWRYKPGSGYQVPNSDSFMLGNDVLRLLDETSNAPIDNHLQLSPTCEKPIHSESESLRLNVINALPIPELLKSSNISISTPSSNNIESTAAPTQDFQSVDDYSSAKRKRNQPSRKGKSVTNFDAGADLFLGPPTKKKKIKKQKKTTNLLEGEREFPSARTIADYYAPLFRQNGRHCLKTLQKFRPHYPQWKFLLSTNHSLLLYGFGSKREVLNDFRTTCLESVGDALAIDGYDSSIHIEDVLDLMVEVYLNNQEPSKGTCTSSGNADGIDSNGMGFSKLSMRAIAIGKAIANHQLVRKQPLYLVIHNIDGLRNQEAQHAISLLLTNSTVQQKIRTIRLVASVDHVSSAMVLWDIETSFHLNFIWKEMHTFQPYIHELQKGTEHTQTRQSMKSKHAVAATTESIYTVLATIAPRPTEVLQVLATLQLKILSAIPFRDLYDACKTKCLIVSDATLREYMTELLTHGLIRKSRENGAENLEIPHSNAILKDILDYSPSRI